MKRFIQVTSSLLMIMALVFGYLDYKVQDYILLLSQTLSFISMATVFYVFTWL